MHIAIGRSRSWPLLVVALAASAPATLVVAQRRADATRATSAPHNTRIAFTDVSAIFKALPAHVPKAFFGKTQAEAGALWPAWIARRDAEIRARLARGDEDSLVNFWLFGTSFTTRPRATERDLFTFGAGIETATLLQGRLDDLIAGLRAPGTNDRLLFARHVVDRAGIDVTTPGGGRAARVYLVGLRTRVAAEYERFRDDALSARVLEDPTAEFGAYARYYRQRGLSSDTSILANFAADRAIDRLVGTTVPRPGPFRRIAIVGPGLDFTDKAEGYDFYPLQTIQPFALIDSLAARGAIDTADVSVTTFDISARITEHLSLAADRARAGAPYVVQLPLDVMNSARQWSTALVDYWTSCGTHIGQAVAPLPPPLAAEAVTVRAIQVRTDIVRSIHPVDLNIIVEHERGGVGYDLIVATNVLVYYDPFEQALAMANVAKMLRPGGWFLSNSAVFTMPPMEPQPNLVTPVDFDGRGNGDVLFWYRRADPRPS